MWSNAVECDVMMSFIHFLNCFLQRLDAKYETDPSAYTLLYEMSRQEVANKTAKDSSSCSNGLLWLTRWIFSLQLTQTFASSVQRFCISWFEPIRWDFSNVLNTYSLQRWVTCSNGVTFTMPIVQFVYRQKTLVYGRWSDLWCLVYFVVIQDSLSSKILFYWILILLKWWMASEYALKAVGVPFVE